MHAKLNEDSISILFFPVDSPILSEGIVLPFPVFGDGAIDAINLSSDSHGSRDESFFLCSTVPSTKT